MINYILIYFVNELKIIGIPGNNIVFNRYNSSVTGHRTEKDCEDVINRLKEFADFAKALNQNKDNEKYLQCFTVFNFFLGIQNRFRESRRLGIRHVYDFICKPLCGLCPHTRALGPRVNPVPSRPCSPMPQNVSDGATYLSDAP